MVKRVIGWVVGWMDGWPADSDTLGRLLLLLLRSALGRSVAAAAAAEYVAAAPTTIQSVLAVRQHIAIVSYLRAGPAWSSVRHALLLRAIAGFSAPCSNQLMRSSYESCPV